ncbi:protein ALTERED SEED GERMINATION 2-like isoform X9 [Magnolia sinica]|uniref:protein ALTERED SEED GERMINATION 2-like isoform X9 n=1 Tax=Magnolia sinica TaxID=86752 RepID=UPI00265A1EF4|nr:protein ALTERED SEED GERMINATION 2-like isoform X9 [Magnolia sinica]
MEDIKGGESSMRYRAGDVAKQMDLDPLLSGAEPSPSQPILLRTGAPHDSHTSSRLRKSYELVQAAEKSLEGPNYSYGIEACSEVLDGNGPEIGTKLKHDCLSTRAALFLKAIVFHYGSISLITEPCKSAHVATAKAAKDAGVFLSYDRILSRKL